MLFNENSLHYWLESIFLVVFISFGKLAKLVFNYAHQNVYTMDKQ